MFHLVPKPSLVISQSVNNPNIGQNHVLTCTVTVANGVSSSLVVIDWSKGGSLSESSRVIISDQTNDGVQYTKTVTFSPLLSNDGGEYTCSVSVNDFDEADNSDSTIIVVTGKLNYRYIMLLANAMYQMF